MSAICGISSTICPLMPRLQCQCIVWQQHQVNAAFTWYSPLIVPWWTRTTIDLYIDLQVSLLRCYGFGSGCTHINSCYNIVLESVGRPLIILSTWRSRLHVCHHYCPVSFYYDTFCQISEKWATTGKNRTCNRMSIIIMTPCRDCGRYSSRLQHRLQSVLN